jgi:hypothetical protein
MIDMNRTLPPALRVLWTVTLSLLVILAATAASANAPAAASAGAASATAPVTAPSLAAYPPQIALSSSRSFQSVIVQLTEPSGITRDLTAAAKFSLENPAIARLDRNTLIPQSDGSTHLIIQVKGHRLLVPVTVTDAAKDRPISFRLDVMPVFSSSGCNSGSCHGAARGKDGFHLSLFGYNPASDYHDITRQIPGRRINLAQPDDSLLLTKAVGSVQHTGGELFTRDSPRYATLRRWIEAGVPDDSADVPTVTSLQIFPPAMVLDGEAASQQMLVTASYSDGTTRDVTALATFITSNDSSASLSPAGLVTAHQRGEAFIMARFDAFTVGSPAIILPKALAYTPPNFPPVNYIDEAIAAKLNRLRIVPADLCSDEVFIRRASLDIIGQLPTQPELEQFLADTAADKRARLVDRLLDRREFTDLWVMKFSELLLIRTGENNDGLSYKAAVLYHSWLSRQFQNNVPMNQIVKQLLAGTGSTFANPATNFYQVERDNLKVTENVAQILMGMRVQCAQCHNHPFDRWTMDDYYGFAAFFTQIGRKKGDDPRDTIIFNSGGGDAKHPVGGRSMAPKFLGGDTPDVKGKDRRAVLADWLASSDNPYFARNLANIVWSHFMGRGIVEPVDDVRVSNPPVNPQLLDALAQRFTEYNYDFRKLVRDICTSRTYQLATTINDTNRLDSTNFSRAYIRRLRAEVLFDVISQVTSTQDQNKFNGLPRGARAVQIANGDTSTYFLTAFGRATRETVCSCEVRMDPNLSQALHLLNGDTVHQKIQQGALVKNWLTNDKLSPEAVIRNLYLRCLSRQPTAAELAHTLDIVTKADNTQQALEDLFWAILNSKEFLFNH